ncbi:MAG: glycosyltransferase family 4 protein [Rhizobiaceae bacterium]
MRIAFYAPMKSPDHPVPSGDRQMARLLIKAFEHAGYTVELASQLRSFCAEPDDSHYDRIEAEAAKEIGRLSGEWHISRPDIWFTYHPYYKSPDLLGPRVARAFCLPYVTAEASYSTRRNVGRWAKTQQAVAEAVRLAAANICFTERDRLGLEQAFPEARSERLPPFIDTAIGGENASGASNRLITVAMMRPGDKLESYRMLARALERLLDLPWTLSIAGDGPCRPDVEAAFAILPVGRIQWLGELGQAEVAAALRDAGLYVWPGFGEAFGLAYLEAQAAGLPVVAQAVAGVPEVVKGDHTGLLTPANDVVAYAGAIRRLLLDSGLRNGMGAAAQRFVSEERSLPASAKRLDQILRKAAL